MPSDSYECATLGQVLFDLAFKWVHKSDQAFLRWVLRSPYYWSRKIVCGQILECPQCCFRRAAERLVETYLSLKFLLRPLDEQREITRILGALDDKIELNRQMNATLEATARAIFKSWFVDFDPVHAKANGEQPVRAWTRRPPRCSPNSLEDSELGMIPAGWRVQPIGEQHESRQRAKAYKGSGLADKRDCRSTISTSVYEGGRLPEYEGIKF